MGGTIRLKVLPCLRRNSINDISQIILKNYKYNLEWYFARPARTIIFAQVSFSSLTSSKYLTALNTMTVAVAMAAVAIALVGSGGSGGGGGGGGRGGCRAGGCGDDGGSGKWQW